MGNRVSIQFVNKKEKSVILFSHWQGMELVKQAKEYIKKLNKWIEEKKSFISEPLDRKQPDTIIVDFIREITKNEERITGDLYLVANENDGDNEDNGHHEINVNN